MRFGEASSAARGFSRASQSTEQMITINPPGWPSPRGYSNGIVAEGRMLFVAGQIGWNEKGEIVGDRLVDQFDRALANVLAIVDAAGGAPASIARLTIYVTDKAAYRRCAV